MREQTITYKVFKFNELSEKAQEKVLDSFYYFNVDHDWWDCCYEMFDEDLLQIGIQNKGYWFSTDRDYYIEMRDPRFSSASTFITAALKDSDLKVKQSIMDIVLNEVSISKTQYARRGQHKIELTYIPAESRCPRLSRLLKDIEDRLNEFLEDTLDSFLKTLQKEYEYRTSKEAIIEAIECNDYDFLENGEIFRG